MARPKTGGEAFRNIIKGQRQEEDALDSKKEATSEASDTEIVEETSQAGDSPKTEKVSPLPPTAKQNLLRTQIYLREDQTEFLDELARQVGDGCSRSEWIRYAIDLLMEEYTS